MPLVPVPGRGLGLDQASDNSGVRDAEHVLRGSVASKISTCLFRPLKHTEVGGGSGVFLCPRSQWRWHRTLPLCKVTRWATGPIQQHRPTAGAVPDHAGLRAQTSPATSTRGQGPNAQPAVAACTLGPAPAPTHPRCSVPPAQLCCSAGFLCKRSHLDIKEVAATLTRNKINILF